jgi:hypothetical protein
MTGEIDGSSRARRKATFVHSLFRSGSTYFFDAIKKAGKCYVYHEPLHEIIGSLPDHWDELQQRQDQLRETLRHGFLLSGYFDEYANLLDGIREEFDEAFSFGDYFLSAEDARPGLSRYINLLIAGAPRRPVLQCTRTVGRIRWLSANFDATNIFLLRNPWDQWYSYKVEPYIAMTPRLICSQRNAPEALVVTLDAAGDGALSGADVQERLNYGFRHPISPATHYCLFFGVWLHAYLSALRDCDLRIDIDELSSSQAYRDATRESLANLGLGQVDFSEASLHRATYLTRENSFFEPLEEQILGIFRQHAAEAEHLDAARDYLSAQRAIAFAVPSRRKFSRASLVEDAARMRRCLAEEEKRHAESVCELARGVSERDEQIAELARGVSEQDGQIAALTQSVAARDGQIAALTQSVAARDEQIAGLNQALAARIGELKVKEQVLADRDGQLRELGEVRQELLDARSALAAVKGSRSWRLTAPYRAVGRAVKKAVHSIASRGLLLRTVVGLLLLPSAFVYYGGVTRAIRSFRRGSGFFAKLIEDQGVVRERLLQRGPFYRRLAFLGFSLTAPILHAGSVTRSVRNFFRVTQPVKATASRLRPTRQRGEKPFLHSSRDFAELPGTAMPEPEALPSSKVELWPRLPTEAAIRGRCLIIDAQWPQPDRDSGSVDALFMACSLRDLGFSVVFASSDTEHVADPALRDPLQRLGIGCLGPETSPSIDAFVVAEGRTVDLVVLSRAPGGGSYFEIVRRECPSARVVFNTVDLHGLREEREALLRGDRAGMALAARQWERETYLTRQCDATIVVSQYEAALLRSHVPGANVVVLPLAREVPGTRRGYVDRRDIGFIGGFSHLPNVDAVKYFLLNMWPTIAAAIPEAEFQVVGADLPPDVW